MKEEDWRKERSWDQKETDEADVDDETGNADIDDEDDEATIDVDVDVADVEVWVPVWPSSLSLQSLVLTMGY